MKNAIHAGALALLLASFQDPPGPEPKLQELAFGWPASGAVAIDEVHSKETLDIEKRYVLRWQPDADGKSLLFDFTDFELVRYGDVSPSDPGVAGALRLVEPLLRAMPRWRIGRTGEFQGHVGFVEGIEQMLASGRASGTFDAGAEKMLRAMIDDPETRLRFEQHSAETWRLWTQAWIGIEIAVDETRTLNSEAAIGTDKVPARTQIRCLERLEHAGQDCVRLELVTILAGDDYVRAVEKRIAAVMPRDPSATERKRVKSARKETSLSGIYEVATLQPHEVISFVVDAFEVVGQAPQRQSEKHVYVFDWKRRVAPEQKPSEEPK